MMRYIYILIFIAVSPCLVRASSYTYNKLPVPEINYFNTPYEQIKDVNAVAHFDASPSFDPEGGQIVELLWNFYKYNGKDWDFLFSARGPGKGIINCKFGEIGYYRARLWVRASGGYYTSRWNQDSDTKDCFIYIIDQEINANQYVAVGSAMTFTYNIKLPKGIKVKEACLTMTNEYDVVLAEVWIKNPVIGKEGKIEWDGKINKGPNAGQSIPPGQFSVNFRVFPFHEIPKKENETEDTLEPNQEHIDPNNN